MDKIDLNNIIKKLEQEKEKEIKQLMLSKKRMISEAEAHKRCIELCNNIIKELTVTKSFNASKNESKELKYLKSTLKSKNCKFVNIRDARTCYHCNIKLEKGTNCLTVNPKDSSRKWYCNNCVQLWLNVLDAHREYNNITFDDIGGGFAALDYIDETLEMFHSMKGYYK